MYRFALSRAVGACLLALTAGTARADVIQIKIESLAFAPPQVAARVGDTVEWVNADFVAHTATARDGRWNVMIPAHGSAKIILKADGTVDYYCQFHPAMIGRLSIAK